MWLVLSLAHLPHLQHWIQYLLCDATPRVLNIEYSFYSSYNIVYVYIRYYGMSPMYIRLLAFFYESEFKFLSSHLTILRYNILLLFIIVSLLCHRIPGCMCSIKQSCCTLINLSLSSLLPGSSASGNYNFTLSFCEINSF